MMIRRGSQGSVSEGQYCQEAQELRRAGTGRKCSARWGEAAWPALELVGGERWRQGWDHLRDSSPTTCSVPPSPGRFPKGSLPPCPPSPGLLLKCSFLLAGQTAHGTAGRMLPAPLPSTIHQRLAMLSNHPSASLPATCCRLRQA